MERIIQAPPFTGSNSPVRAQRIIGQRPLGQIGTAPEIQFNNNYWQKREKEKNKDNSFKIPDTLFKFISKQQISDWVQLVQDGLGWSPTYLIIVRSLKSNSMNI